MCKKYSVDHCRVDQIKYQTFYSGYGYKATPSTISEWTKYEFPNLFLNVTDEEIIHNHIYWATNSANYMGTYNGDTYVLFHNMRKLSEEMNHDAQNDFK